MVQFFNRTYKTYDHMSILRLEIKFHPLNYFSNGLHKECKLYYMSCVFFSLQNLSKSPSVMLVFQSLCRFFSSVDPSGLLELPANVTEVCLHILSIHCLLKHVKFYIKIKHVKFYIKIKHVKFCIKRVDFIQFFFVRVQMIS